MINNQFFVFFYLYIYFHYYFVCCMAFVFALVASTRTLCADAGDVHQTQIRSDEESLRVVGTVRLRDRSDHLQQLQQAVPVRLHRHGQSAA